MLNVVVECQWSDEKEQLEDRLSSLHGYQENSDQWQLSIDQIKNERDEVTDTFSVLYYSLTSLLFNCLFSCDYKVGLVNPTVICHPAKTVAFARAYIDYRSTIRGFDNLF